MCGIQALAPHVIHMPCWLTDRPGEPPGSTRGLQLLSVAVRSGGRCDRGRSPSVQGEHTDALGKYAMALSYVNDDFMVQLHGPHAAKAAAVKQPVHLNMAACQLKLEDWQGAAWNCSQVWAAVSAAGACLRLLSSEGHMQVLQTRIDSFKALFRQDKAMHS